LGQDLFCNIGRLGQVVAVADALVLEPGNIQRIIAFLNLLAGKAAEPVILVMALSSMETPLASNSFLRIVTTISA